MITNAAFIEENFMDNFLWIINDCKVNNDLLEYKGNLWDLQVGKSKHFLEEKYARILCEILPSDRFVEHFMSQYVTKGNSVEQSVNALEQEKKDCSDIHNSRKINIKEEALKLPGFVAYLKTDAAQKVVDAFIEKVSVFCTKGKNHLWGNDVYQDKDVLENELRGAFLNFKNHNGDEKEIYHDALDYFAEGVLKEDVLEGLIAAYAKEINNESGNYYSKR